MYTIEAIEHGQIVEGLLYSHPEDGQFETVEAATEAIKHCIRVWHESTDPEARKPWHAAILDEDGWIVKTVEAN